MTASTDTITTNLPAPKPKPSIQLFTFKEFRKNGGWNLPNFLSSHDLAVPGDHVQVLRCVHEIVPGVHVSAISWGDLVVVVPGKDENSRLPGHPKGGLKTDVESFLTAELLGDPYTKEWVPPPRNTWNRRPDTSNLPKVESFKCNGRWAPYLLQDVKIGINGTDFSRGVTLWLEPPSTGKIEPIEGTSNIRVSGEYLGVKFEWEEDLLARHRNRNLGYGNSLHDRRDPEEILHHHLKNGTWEDDAQIQAFWAHFLKVVVPHRGKLNRSGVKGLENRKAIKPNLERLQKEELVLFAFYEFLHNAATVNGVKNNQLLGAFLKECGADYDKLVAGLKVGQEYARHNPLRNAGSYHHELRTRKVCESLPGAAMFILERMAKTDARLRKTNESKAEGLDIDPADYPQLHKAILAGNIPVGVFFQPGGDQPVNREYLIWEKALEQKGWAPVIYDICQNASGRNTYERDITSYLSFLFHLPRYLDRNTEGRKKWKAVPKFVQSQWELEMEEASEEGTTKRRSAFTPVADNETRIVMVPYVAVEVMGRFSTWCYSRHYYVFEEGMVDPESKGMVVSDREDKLNGRDDYGLMYYTLTGTEQNRGYPTFLIIFERLRGGTRVHFHRVHPCRSKKGIKTQACDLVARCYQYMAGNIPATEVIAQQGDLIFLHAKEMGKAIKEGQQVSEFESHRFSHQDGSSVILFESTAKTPKNRLGYIDAKTSFSVRHPEHEDIQELGPGLIEVRRCKSWEANPTAVWSMTID